MTAQTTVPGVQQPTCSAQPRQSKRRTWKAGRQMEGRSKRILELAGTADGVTGHQVAEAFGVCGKAAAAMLSQLATDGYLHRGKVPRTLMHFFTSTAAARAWEARQIAPGWRLDLPSTPVNLPRPDRIKAAAAKAPRPVVMAEGVKVTRCPSINHDPRYQVDPTMQIVGGWATAGVGVDITTGRAWGR